MAKRKRKSHKIVPPREWWHEYDYYEDNPSGRKRIYARVIEIKAQKGQDSLWPGERFRHRFTSKDAEIIGEPDGSLTIRSRSGKRLWREFEYE